MVFESMSRYKQVYFDLIYFSGHLNNTLDTYQVILIKKSFLKNLYKNLTESRKEKKDLLEKFQMA